MAARLLKDPATAGSRIFIGHLQTEDINRNELEEHFSKYGTIIGSLLNRGFGFVQFEDELSAQNAIKNENGAMFKGRRIDVKPAKKETGSGNSMGGFGNDPFNNSFGGGNPNFNNSNSPFGNDNQFGRGGGGNGGNNSFSDQEEMFGGRNNNDSFNSNKGNGPPFGGNRSGGPGNSNMNRNQNNQNQGGPNQGGPNQMGGPGNRHRGTRGGKNRKRDGSLGDRMGGGMDDRLGDHAFGDRMGGGMGDRMGGGIGDSMGGNLGSGLGTSFRSGLGGVLGGGLGSNLGNNLSGNMGSGLGGGMGSGHGLGNSLSGIGSFRDRSPIGRSGRLDDKPLSNWELNKSGPTGGRGGFGGYGDHKSRYDDFKGPASIRDVGSSFGPSSSTSNDYPSIAAEKNDCEIIVVNKALTEYAEIIESRLKKLGLTVDLLFPNEDVPLTRVLGNIASRGCLYAIVIAPTNKEHHSLTLNILHGLPQEHRNMPVDDSISLIMRDFNNYKSGGRSVPVNVSTSSERHPDAIQVLLNMLADNLQLTVLQYERVIKYLEMRREEQVQFELGEDAKNLGPTSLVSDPKQAELQSRILNILNSNKSTSSTASTTTVTTAAPSPVPPPAVSTNVSGNSSVTTSSAVTPSPLLNDPTVQKALDSLLQANLLKNIGDQPIPTTSATPLFAAFPNINRF